MVLLFTNFVPLPITNAAIYRNYHFTANTNLPQIPCLERASTSPISRQFRTITNAAIYCNYHFTATTILPQIPYLKRASTPPILHCIPLPFYRNQQCTATTMPGACLNTANITLVAYHYHFTATTNVPQPPCLERASTPPISHYHASFVPLPLPVYQFTRTTILPQLPIYRNYHVTSAPLHRQYLYNISPLLLHSVDFACRQHRLQ